MGIVPQVADCSWPLVSWVSDAARKDRGYVSFAHISTPLTIDHREIKSRAAKAKLLNEWNNWTELGVLQVTMVV